jgi:stress response protein YsnF
VVVHADEGSIERASDILNAAGAIDVDERTDDRARIANEPGSDYDTRNRNTVRNTELRKGESTTIPVVRENLNVGKRAIQRGGVRVHSTVTERPVEEKVQLRDERVRVDRRPADRPATEADLAAANRDVIEVNETVEEPVVNKSARVVEEVVISKDVRDRTETVRDRVQQSDAKVEDARGQRPVPSRESVYGGTRTDYDPDFRNDFRTRYGTTPNARYEEYEPAYRYGYEMASEPRYQGRGFRDVEDTVRADYLRRNPGTTWDRIKGAIEYGWNKVTGKR